MKNVYGKTLKPCSKQPLTGFNRDGYCKGDKYDRAKHHVCAKMNQKFMDFTRKRGNDLSSVVKPGDKWCICLGRYAEAYNMKSAPKIVKSATNLHAKSVIDKLERQTFHFNDENVKKAFDVYIDKNPMDTIKIKYKTLDDVKATIRRLETLYKTGKYSHKRIWLVAMILRVRLRAIMKRYKTPDIEKRYLLSDQYFKFMKARTRAKKKSRKKMRFTIKI